MPDAEILAAHKAISDHRRAEEAFAQMADKMDRAAATIKQWRKANGKVPPPPLEQYPSWEELTSVARAVFETYKASLLAVSKLDDREKGPFSGHLV